MEKWEENNKLKLMKAVEGITLTEEETKTIKWIAGWDDYTINNIISIIEKVKEMKKRGAASK